MSDIFGNLDNFLENYDENNLSSISGLSDSVTGVANDSLANDCSSTQNSSVLSKTTSKTRRGKATGSRPQPNNRKKNATSSETVDADNSVLSSAAPVSVHTVVDLASSVSVPEEMQLLSSLFQSIYNSRNPFVKECLKNREAALIKRSFTTLSNGYNRKPPVKANDVNKLKKKIDAVRKNLNQLNQTIKAFIQSSSVASAPKRSGRRSRNTTEGNHRAQAPIVISLDCDDDPTPIPSSVYPYNRPVTRRITANAAIEPATGSNFISLDSDDDSLPGSGGQQQLDHSIVGNNSFETENYEMRIKVKWGMGIETFVHRKFQKFADIIDQLAAKESADSAFILLNLDDRILYPNDTPDSISYKPHQFISGRILKNKAPILPSAVTSSAASNNSITLKVQTATRKQPLRLQMDKNQTMSVLVIKCAEELKCDPKDIKLYFDGELVENSYKPEDLDLEGDEILDICLAQR